jgi:hypothetical protein
MGFTQHLRRLVSIHLLRFVRAVVLGRISAGLLGWLHRRLRDQLRRARLLELFDMLKLSELFGRLFTLQLMHVRLLVVFFRLLDLFHLLGTGRDADVVSAATQLRLLRQWCAIVVHSTVLAACGRATQACAGPRPGQWIERLIEHHRSATITRTVAAPKHIQRNAIG